MLAIITYSCFTSAYYAAFSFPTAPVFLLLEHCVFAFFLLEIIFKLMTISPSEENRSHFFILKRYVKSGWFFLDVTATFPFYLIEGSISSGNSDADNSSSYSLFLKLLRMIRLPKIMNLLDLNRLNKVINHLLAG